MRRFFIQWGLVIGLPLFCWGTMDRDEDGLSDVFEQQHGGILEPQDDNDQDGLSNYAEYLFGGDPLKGNDRLIGKGPLNAGNPDTWFVYSLEGETIEVQWRSEEGLRYQVEISSDLSEWQSEGDIVEGNGLIMSHTLSQGTGGSAQKLFWRITGYPPLDGDEDGLNEWEEAVLGMDRNNPDEDSDGILDGWEWQIFSAAPDDGIDTVADVLPNDDFDGDGLSNRDEFRHNLDPQIDDSSVPANQQTYNYDLNGRLTEANAGSNLNYGYDNEGNLTTGQ